MSYHQQLFLMTLACSFVTGFILCWGLFVHPRRKAKLTVPRDENGNIIWPPAPPERHWTTSPLNSIRFTAGFSTLLQSMLTGLPAEDSHGQEGHHLRHLLLIYHKKRRTLTQV